MSFAQTPLRNNPSAKCETVWKKDPPFFLTGMSQEDTYTCNYKDRNLLYARGRQFVHTIVGVESPKRSGVATLDHASIVIPLAEDTYDKNGCAQSKVKVISSFDNTVKRNSFELLHEKKAAPYVTLETDTLFSGKINDGKYWEKKKLKTYSYEQGLVKRGEEITAAKQQNWAKRQKLANEIIENQNEIAKQIGLKESLKWKEGLANKLTNLEDAKEYVETQLADIKNRQLELNKIRQQKTQEIKKVNLLVGKSSALALDVEKLSTLEKDVLELNKQIVELANNEKLLKGFSGKVKDGFTKQIQELKNYDYKTNLDLIEKKISDLQDQIGHKEEEVAVLTMKQKDMLCLGIKLEADKKLIKNLSKDEKHFYPVENGDVVTLPKDSFVDLLNYSFLLGSDNGKKDVLKIASNDQGQFEVKQCCLDGICEDSYKFISNQNKDTFFSAKDNADFLNRLRPIPSCQVESVQDICDVYGTCPSTSLEIAPEVKRHADGVMDILAFPNFLSAYYKAEDKSRTDARNIGFLEQYNRGENLVTFPYDPISMKGPYNTYHYTPESADTLISAESMCTLNQVLKTFEIICKEWGSIGCQVQMGDMFFDRDHGSHGGGLSIDIRPFRKNSDVDSGLTINSSSYDRNKTMVFITLLKIAGASNIFFNDKKVITASIKNKLGVKEVNGTAKKHNDHFHFQLNHINPKDKNDAQKMKEICKNGFDLEKLKKDFPELWPSKKKEVAAPVVKSTKKPAPAKKKSKKQSSSATKSKKK